jgi:DNA-binding MarR family transcriptional regulator
MKARGKASPPSVDTEAGVFIAFMRVADTFGGEAELVVKAAGLTGAQYNVLRILRGAGTAGLACREIGERMISRDPDITRLLDRMEKRGLITRERQRDDRRVIKTFATASGLQILKTLDQPVRELHQKQFRHLSAKKLSTLAAMLAELQAELQRARVGCDPEQTNTPKNRKL